MSLKHFQNFQDESYTILEEFCLTSGINSKYTAIAKSLQDYVIDELDNKLENFIEYELSIFWESPVLSISEYVLQRYQTLISADVDQTLGSLLKNLVVMKKLARTLSDLPQFQVTSKIYERVCWMFVIPTYDTIVSKDFYNRSSQRFRANKEIWTHFKNRPSDMELMILQSERFNEFHAQRESNRLVRFLVKKCAEINAETCELHERLSRIASEISPGELASGGHFNSFSSINKSDESLTTNDYHDEN